MDKRNIYFIAAAVATAISVVIVIAIVASAYCSNSGPQALSIELNAIKVIDTATKEGK